MLESEINGETQINGQTEIMLEYRDNWRDRDISDYVRIRDKWTDRDNWIVISDYVRIQR